MSVSGVPSSQPVQPPSTSSTSATSSTTTSQPASFSYGPFASDPAFAEIAAGTKTLGMGSRGDEVKILEEALVAATGPLPWGAQPNTTLKRATEKALTDFQNSHGLTPSGKLDADTLAKLDDVLGGGGTSGTGTTSGTGSTGSGSTTGAAFGHAPFTRDPAFADILAGNSTLAFGASGD
ncbi:MAG: peptidoglycan-binding domain-containing protein, partial [Planctomycetota bacterium]